MAFYIATCFDSKGIVIRNECKVFKQHQFWYFYVTIHSDLCNYLLKNYNFFYYSVLREMYFLLFEVFILLLCMENQGFALKTGILNCY
jgi:hypothetical protein